MRQTLLFLFSFIFSGLIARQEILPTNPYAANFSEAYSLYPQIPKGILEAVAFTNTKFYQLTGNEQSCMGIPNKFGVMGLMEDGKGWFRNNLITISNYSGYSVEQIKTDPRINILAYAKAYDYVANQFFEVEHDLTALEVVQELNELPFPLTTDSLNTVNQKYFVQQTWEYDIFKFLSDEKYSGTYNFPVWNVDMKNLFGENNLQILSATNVNLSSKNISDNLGNSFQINDAEKNNSVGENLRNDQNNNVQSPDYGPAIWNPAASCNYSSRNGTLITAVTIHDVEGSYAGCISWFQNCAAQVSAHYVVRSSDGQITQMVLESNKAWHVGSENGYTIGIEHEGYQSQTGWYTNAMYAQSSALVRNICADNNIDPLRTGWWPWLPNTYYNVSGIPGSCCKVKGHMHFPNQTHDDPGPNWDWNYFYRLINNTPPVATMLTTATGNFYDSGGASANYSDNERTIWTIAPANATSVTVSFNSYNTENTWDYLFIYDGADINAPLIGEFTGTNNPGTITSSGGSLTFEFRSDCSTNAAGWNATWSSQINNINTDVIAPTTNVTVNGNWQTTNFQTAFSDSDNVGGSGLEKSFYQVIDFDGTDWRANNTQGFFSDNFDLAAINPEWTSVTGTWAINNGVLEQSDEAPSNTNIYAPLTQNLSNKYLFNWSGKIDGTGNNRRAGFHFFSDNGSLTNRGNSYFVWFRVDQSVCEFYKVVNDVFTLENSVPMTVNANQWYDWKVVYDRITGKMEVYQDNSFVGSWTDPTPYSSGNAISFRSGNCDWQINNFKVYRSRASNAPMNVSLGTCPSCEIRFQNTNPATPSGRVKSIVRDSAGNFSAVAFQDINVDWTVPLNVDTVNDGSNADIDLSISPTTLPGNWSASSDPNSGLARYYYALGTTVGDSDVVGWTSNWGFDTVVMNNLALANMQWYYLSVRAENGAGLRTQNFTSDGVLIDLTTGISITDQNNFSASVGPNPFSENSTVNYSLPENVNVKIVLHDVTGREINLVNEKQAAGNHSLQINSESLSLAPGIYLLSFSYGTNYYTLPLIKK
jgi:N-acetyl-anhydromuramyl-L-alanine amidase AmpD